jgi:hypothetical protein
MYRSLSGGSFSFFGIPRLREVSVVVTVAILYSYKPDDVRDVLYVSERVESLVVLTGELIFKINGFAKIKTPLFIWRGGACKIADDALTMVDTPTKEFSANTKTGLAFPL